MTNPERESALHEAFVLIRVASDLLDGVHEHDIADALTPILDQIDECITDEDTPETRVQ